MSEVDRMLRDIRAEVKYTRQFIRRNALSERVMEAMAKVPRHEFVGEGMKARAYDNGPLPIGWGQTISQPYIVALMTDLAELGEHDRVLEVGTGSGYQTAILAELVERVYSIEIISELSSLAAERLQRMGYDNVEFRINDGYHGWAEEAPFDAILITAAPVTVPPPLVDQLKPGGRLVAPIGGRFSGQELILLEKEQDGGLKRSDILPVAFVPLTGSH